MPTHLFAKSFLLGVVATMLAACSQTAGHASSASARPEPPLYVPSTMIAQADGGPAAINPYQLLPASDAETLYVGRPEKFVYGGMVYEQGSSYTIQTFDQQLISNLYGPSYRYRWVTQQGVTSP